MQGDETMTDEAANETLVLMLNQLKDSQSAMIAALELISERLRRVEELLK
jgi:hypothetical protein